MEYTRIKRKRLPETAICVRYFLLLISLVNDISGYEFVTKRQLLTRKENEEVNATLHEPRQSIPKNKTIKTISKCNSLQPSFSNT